MNQSTKAFLTEFRDLCRRHGVDFSADFHGRVTFTSHHAVHWVEADVASFSNLEAQLAKAKP